MSNLRPKVGIGCLIFKDGKILLGKRKNSHGDGMYGGTGGHLEHMESVYECIRRETLEECGIEIDNIRFICTVNFRDHDPKHYIDLGFVADWVSGDPEVREPHKLESWGWFDLDNLPDPLFEVIPKYIEAYKNQQILFFD